MNNIITHYCIITLVVVMIPIVGLLLSLYLIERNKDMVALVYVSLIIKGKKKFSQCPATLKEQVRQILIDLDLEYLIDE